LGRSLTRIIFAGETPTLWTRIRFSHANLNPVYEIIAGWLIWGGVPPRGQYTRQWISRAEVRMHRGVHLFPWFSKPLKSLNAFLLFFKFFFFKKEKNISAYIIYCWKNPEWTIGQINDLQLLGPLHLHWRNYGKKAPPLLPHFVPAG